MEKTIVGAVITSIILSIMTHDTGIFFFESTYYGIAGVLVLYFWSIVCTVGVGLIFWIPIWYGVGWIAITTIVTVANITEAFLMKNDRQPDAQKSKLLLLTDRLNQELLSGFSLNTDQLALLNYIKKARIKGLNDDQISQNLTNNGWTTDSITTAFQMAGNGA